MAITPLYYPSGIHSVYRPATYRVVTDSYAVPNIFASQALITQVRKATATDVAQYGLSINDVIVEHTGSSEPIYAGMLFKIPGTAGPSDLSGTSRYPDTYRVTRVLSSTAIVISAPYAGETTTGGYLFRVLGNFKIIARITGPHIQRPIEYALTPVLEDDGFFGQPGYVFELDARDAIARHFKDIKDILNSSSGGIVSGDGYITQLYNVDMFEAYDVVSSDGTITFTRFDGADDVRYIFLNSIAANAIHPYHQLQRDGSVPIDYVDTDFDSDYRVTNSGGTLKRFLTYMDRTRTTIRRGDSFFLAWLNQPLGAGGSSRRVSITFESDTAVLGTITAATTSITAASMLCNVGPAIASAPAATTKARVRVTNASGLARTETFTLNLQACKGINKRWYYLNKLGGVDAFTFEGDETRQMGVQRETISKPSMALPDITPFGQTWRGDWQRRVWRTQPQRKYTITSGYLLPIILRNIAEEMFESANVFTELRPGYWTNIIPLTTEVPGDSDTGRAERFVIQYQLGVDNLTQRT